MPDRQAISQGVAVLNAGEALILFPDGQRRSGSEVKNLHDGVAYLATRAQVPIVPWALPDPKTLSDLGSSIEIRS